MQTTDRTLTKIELRDKLNCTTWRRFYKIFMTDKVITDILQMSVQEYKRVREFNYEQSMQLREYFGLKETP
jgi:hypothetical protein